MPKPAHGENKYKHPNGYFTPEAKEVVRQLKEEENLEDREIAERMGISRFGVRALALRIGITYEPLKVKRWTRDDDRAIITMLEQGKSRLEIAAWFGITKNALIGRCNRLGLCDKRNNAKARTEATQARQINTKIYTRTILPVAARKPIKPSYEAAVREIVDPATETPYGARPPILTRNRDGYVCVNEALTELCCRWPLGDPKEIDFGFCGRPTAPGRPYCQAHTERAYMKVPVLRTYRGFVLPT